MFATLTPWGPRAVRPGNTLEFELPTIFDKMFGAEEAWWPHKDGFLPQTDIIETAGRYEVTVELPGMKTEDVHVEVQEGKLLIYGVKQDQKEEKGKTFHRVERRYGEFRRLLPLPGPVDEGMVTAQFKDGVLTVAVPKLETARTKTIEVKG